MSTSSPSTRRKLPVASHHKLKVYTGPVLTVAGPRPALLCASSKREVSKITGINLGTIMRQWKEAVNAHERSIAFRNIRQILVLCGECGTWKYHAV